MIASDTGAAFARISPAMDAVGVVVIGRNEGERLRLCLESLQHLRHRVYVDSGSTDGSQALAAAEGFDVVQLETPPNFTAARARNAGFKRLLETKPDLELVQMVDGDCEVEASWLASAAEALRNDAQLAVVFGRRRERFPEASVYNMICDDEWNVPIGEARSCGGDAMFRVRALAEAGGYTPTLIAGEEPDLCLRLRQKGWRIYRIDAPMTVHDAHITRFSQWWKRAQRSGHAFAELTHRHGLHSDRGWKRDTARILGWGGGLVAACIFILTGFVLGAAWLIYLGAGTVGLFAAQTMRLVLLRRRRCHSVREAVPWAMLLMLGKIPQLQGLIQYHLRRGNDARFKLIEYKS
jgi:GT2 family glycosyltransferase